jgi:hypothetical protein
VPLPTGQDVLTEVLRDGARRMLAQAIEAEAAAWIEAHAHRKDEAGHKRWRRRPGHRSFRCSLSRRRARPTGCFLEIPTTSSHFRSAFRSIGARIRLCKRLGSF